MIKRLWPGWTLALFITACGGDDNTLFVAVTADGPGTARVLFDEVTVLDGTQSLEWNPEQVTTGVSRSKSAKRCERDGQPGICFELASGGATTVSFRGLPDASPVGELDLFERRTEDAFRRCQENPFDSARLDCRAEPGDTIFVELVFRPVQDFRQLGVGVEGKGTAEAAIFRQPALQANLLTAFVTGIGAARAPVRFRATPAEGEVFVEWTGDCRGRPPEFEGRLDSDLRCTAHFRSDDATLPGLCAADERVDGGACVACPSGETNPPGDDPSGTDTTCIPPLCGPDERVADGQCVACSGSDINVAEDNPRGPDTTCDGPRCPTDYRVEAGACVPCAALEINGAGDDPAGADTSCDPIEFPVDRPSAPNPSPTGCAVNNGGCDVNATCSEAGETIECQCRPGFVGDGISCQAVNLAVNLPTSIGVPALCEGRGGYDFRWQLQSSVTEAPRPLGSRIWIPGDHEWAETTQGVRVYDASGWTDCAPLPTGGTVEFVGSADTGWILGGDFTSIGGQPCSGWARLNAQLEVDPDFCQALPPALTHIDAKVDGDVLYAVGNGPSGFRFVAIDLATNAVRFNIEVFGQDGGRSLSVGSEHVVLLGFGFDTTRTDFVAFDKTTGAEVNAFTGYSNILLKVIVVGSTAFGYASEGNVILAWDLAAGTEVPGGRVFASGPVTLVKVGDHILARATSVDADPQPLGTDAFFEILSDGSVTRWNYGDPSLTAVGPPDLGFTDAGVVRVTLDSATRTINVSSPEFAIEPSQRSFALRRVPTRLSLGLATNGSRLMAAAPVSATFDNAGALWDPTTGSLEPVALPPNDGTPRQLVSVPVPSESGALYALWGDFTTVGGQARDGFALIELTDTGSRVIDFINASVPQPSGDDRGYAFVQDRLFVRDDATGFFLWTVVNEFISGATFLTMPEFLDTLGARGKLAVTSRGLVAHGEWPVNLAPYDIYEIQVGMMSDPSVRQTWADSTQDLPSTFLGEAGGRIFFGPTLTAFDAVSTRVSSVTLPFERQRSRVEHLVNDNDTTYLAGNLILNGESHRVIAVNSQTLALIDWQAPPFTVGVQQMIVVDDGVVIIGTDNSVFAVDKASP